MERKVKRWLSDHDGCYQLEDLFAGIEDGTFQSHTFGDTWVITRVNQWPRRKSVHIELVAGDLKEFWDGLPSLYEWTKDVGGDLITGSGRPGWTRFGEMWPGWHFTGHTFSKDLRDGRPAFHG